MASSQELAGGVAAQVGKGPSVTSAARSLAARLASTMLPMVVLLAAFAAVEPQLAVPGRLRSNGEIFFWFHYGALALCYLFGLHWTEHRRILSAARASLVAAAIMTIVTVILTYVGIVTGMIVAGVFLALLPPDAVFAVFIIVPGLAGMAWGAAAAILAHGLSAGSDFPSGWLRLHGLWGAVAGPPMLFSAMAPVPLYVPALTTAATTLALTVVSWWWLWRSRASQGTRHG